MKIFVRRKQQQKEFEKIRMEFWQRIYSDYVGSANATKKDGAVEWADIAMKHFDKRFKPNFPMSPEEHEKLMNALRS